MNMLSHPCRVQPRFELGRILTTPGALEACPAIHMQRCLARHVTGDWGHIGSQDALQNEVAITDGGSIMSAYVIDPAKPCKAFGENRLWIVTEADRSETTLLLPDEYVNHRRRASRPTASSTQTQGELA
ncbi:MAG: type restriction endonuclease subunit [Bryobacterales bacterium]|nr:type restriction endonuclease subunit [Bryobacterales bacterium]